MLKKALLILLVTCSFLSTGTSQINCDFSYTNPTDCGGFAVDFCDLSTSDAGEIVAWNWNMEVSTFSVECPSMVFGLSGVYTVCLTVTDSEGNTCTECKDDLIQVYELPIPEFESTMPLGCTPLDVTFTDLSVGTDGTIVDWVWGLGGSTGTPMGPGPHTSTYADPGSYNISLTVTDDNGCVGSINKTAYVNVSPIPEVNISAVDTFQCTGPFLVSFINNSDLAANSFFWDFGNNQSFVGDTPPAITYNDPGSYTVTVTATNDLTQCENTIVLTDFINIGYPASFSFTPDNGCEDLQVSFTDESLFPAEMVEWDFGDGTTSQAVNPVHLYTNPGCFVVQLTRLVEGCVSVSTTTNCINVDPEPNVWYTNDNLLGCEVPHVVNFAGVSATADSWLWDFGDGNTSTLQNPTHTYEGFGMYPVTLTVANELGCTKDTLINTINVTELEGILADNFYDGCIPLTVTLDENSTSVTNIISWDWEATDGTNVFTSTDPNPIFTILDTGIYNVSLIVENTLGCIDTAFFSGVIEAGEHLDVNFEATPVDACVNEPVVFTDLTSGNVDFWFWDFGDGGTSNFQDPEYVYVDTGFYDVNLSVVHNGCFSDTTFENYIHVMAPIARFDVITDCEFNLERSFISTAIGADSVFWDFGVLTTESDTTSETNPVFTFPEPGTYTVVQWVTNFATLCSHTTSFEVIITSPIADFTITPQQGCAPLSVTMIDGSNDAVSWNWSSLNGTIPNNTIQNPIITYTQPGLFEDDITLIVTDVNACQDTLTFSDSIWVNQSTPSFTSDVTTGCAPLSVSFTDLSVNDYFAEIESWSWNFGPGLGTSTEQNPEFTFNSLGLYDVILTVTDSWGCVNSLTLAGYVDVTSPGASFTVDTLSCTQNELQFQSTSAGWQLEYSWDFGDGGTSDLANPIHAYLAEGTFTTCLTIMDGYSCESIFCQDIVVADPVAAFSVDTLSAPCPPLPVNFTNESINATSYIWNYGDGNAPSSLESPLYVYTEPGIYDVQLIAISTPSCQDTLMIDDLINLDGPVGEYTVSIDSSCAPAEITFVANAFDFYTFIWDFGEGQVDSSEVPIIYDSLTYVYDSTGTFTPTLSFVNSTGCFRTLPVVTDIYVAGLETDIITSQTIICGDDAVGISYSPVLISTDSILSIEWIFENGNPPNSTQLQPIIFYDLPGYHDVTLITDAGLCVDSLVLEDHIRVGAIPAANFAMSVDDEGCDPLSISFLDNSSVSEGAIVSWSWDFGDGTTSTEQHPTHVFGPGANIAVNLVVTTDIGCTNNFFDNIVVFPLTDLEVSGDVEVCIGEATQLQGTIVNGDITQMTYFWEPSTGLSCVDCLDPWVLSPTNTTTYTLVVTNSENCTSEASVTVFVTPFEVPELSLSPDTSLCANQLTQLFVGVQNNVLVYDYQWDTNVPGLSCYDNCFNPVATPDVTSTYVVTVTTDQGCSSIDSVIVEIEDMFQPFTGEDKTICEGDSIELDASFGQNPEWLINTDLTCVFCPNPIAFPDTTMIYVVQVLTDMGCEIIDTIVVNTLAADAVGAGEDITICLGEETILQGFGPGQISWSPDASLSDPNILNPEALPSEDTEFIMTAVNGDCVYFDTMQLEVNEETEIEGTQWIICEGDEIQISVNGFADQYQWTPEEAVSNSTAATPLVSPETTTTYSVTASLGLCDPAVADVLVEVIPAPLFTMDKKRYYLNEQTLQLNIALQEAGNFTYEWAPSAGLSCSNCPNPTVSPTENIVYNLTVTNEDTGCSSTRPVSLEKLTDCTTDLVGVPNVFSPNDDGANDELTLIVSPTVLEIKIFSIFDRWGGLVFSTGSQNGSWDGNYKGQKMQEGVYVYLVQFVCGLDGSLMTKKGDVTIMR